MWTVVYVAPDEATAEQIKEHLTAEGFLVKVRAAGGPRACAGAFEVLVPEAEAEEANDLLNQNWSPGGR
ncbi:MAG: glutamate decarboxylase [Clostridia bacterium]|nr:glutamate decarboxylase [Clostridia bacterium]